MSMSFVEITGFKRKGKKGGKNTERKEKKEEERKEEKRKGNEQRERIASLAGRTNIHTVHSLMITDDSLFLNSCCLVYLLISFLPFLSLASFLPFPFPNVFLLFLFLLTPSFVFLIKTSHLFFPVCVMK